MHWITPSRTRTFPWCLLKDISEVITCRLIIYFYNLRQENYQEQELTSPKTLLRGRCKYIGIDDLMVPQNKIMLHFDVPFKVEIPPRKHSILFSPGCLLYRRFHHNKNSGTPRGANLVGKQRQIQEGWEGCNPHPPPWEVFELVWLPLSSSSSYQKEYHKLFYVFYAQLIADWLIVI